MHAYAYLQSRLPLQPRTWLITGVAGFVGSHLLEALLTLNQRVVGLDNFATGQHRNLDEVQSLVSAEQWAQFTFIAGDICNLADCQRACQGVDHVLHQAALDNTHHSLENPIATHTTNATGFLHMLMASLDAQVKSFTYATSGSTYGDHPGLPKVEHTTGKPLNPYALTKYVNELYADVFARNFGFAAIGLRYFNLFGPRQDATGIHAPVIPKWASAMLQGQPVFINGDGETSRDFCHVANAVQANLLAATAAESPPPLFSRRPGDQGTVTRILPPFALGDGKGRAAWFKPPQQLITAAPPQAPPLQLVAGGDFAATQSPLNQVYNIAVGERTTLNDLFFILRDTLVPHGVPADIQPQYRGFRAGDLRHSQADISKARRLLGYAPTHRLADGLAQTMPWYVQQAAAA